MYDGVIAQPAEPATAVAVTGAPPVEELQPPDLADGADDVHDVTQAAATAAQARLPRARLPLHLRRARWGFPTLVAVLVAQWRGGACEVVYIC